MAYPLNNTKHKILDLCEEVIRDAMYEAIETGDTAATCTVETNDGYIDIMTDEKNQFYADVRHDKDELRNSPNLVSAIIKVIPYWDDVADEWDSNNEEQEYDEWNEHGFANASDYYSYRYG